MAARRVESEAVRSELEEHSAASIAVAQLESELRVNTAEKVALQAKADGSQQLVERMEARVKLAEAEAMRLSGIRSDLNRSPAENQARLRAEIQEREREWQEMLRRSDERAAPTQLALARAAREREEMMERERRRQSLEARDRAERSRKAAVLNARSALSSARRLLAPLASAAVLNVACLLLQRQQRRSPGRSTSIWIGLVSSRLRSESGSTLLRSSLKMGCLCPFRGDKAARFGRALVGRGPWGELDQRPS